MVEVGTGGLVVVGVPPPPPVVVPGAPAPRAPVDDLPALRDGVALVGGEARFRHVYAEPGAGPDVLAAWRSVLRDRASVLTRHEAVAAGWFGAVEGGAGRRVGVAGRPHRGRDARATAGQ